MKFIKSEKGMAMPLVLIVMIVLALLGTAIWQYSVFEIRQAQYFENKTRAYYVARSGAESVARYIMRSPSELDAILGNNDENLSLPFVLDSEYIGEAGEVEVEVKRMENYIYEITGIGTSNGVQQTVTLVLESRPVFGGASVIVTGDGNVDFDKGMTVTGSIVAGGSVSVPDNFDETQYSITPNYDFSGISFPAVDMPSEDTYTIQVNNLQLNNNDTYSVPSGAVVNFTGTTRVNNGGELIIQTAGTTQNNPTILIFEFLNMQGGSIILEGNGYADIYIRPGSKSHRIQTSNTSFPEDARLNVYLGEGCELYISANAPFEGLIYGPYDTQVALQAGASINGAIITESLTGIGKGTSIGNQNSIISFFRGFEDLDIQPGIQLLYWKP